MSRRMGWLGLVLLGLVLAAAVRFSSTAQAQQSVTPSFTTSRFALLSGPISVRPELKNGDTKTENTVFKVDTYSGSVWMLDVSVSADGGRTAVWVPVGNK